MKISQIIAFLLVLISISACSKGKYADYKTADNGLRYKLLNKSLSSTQLITGDIVELKLKYSSPSDSVLFNSEELGVPFRMQIDKTSHKGGSFEDALKLLSPGSCAKFIIPADSFFNKTMHKNLPQGVKKGSELIFEITILKKLDKKEIDEERQLMAKKMKEQEETFINQYVTENNITIEPKLSGLFFIDLKKGNGRKVKIGDKLKVNYKGMLMDGSVFDSSYDRKEAYTFVLGKGDVIQGWEEGFSYMQYGGRAKLIIPSYLAYGKKGYGSIIPPYSTLIFEVELLGTN